MASTIKNSNSTVHLVAPKVPGAVPSVLSKHESVDAAWQAARERLNREERPDLRAQDVRIELPSGQLLSYAGGLAAPR